MSLDECESARPGVLRVVACILFLGVSLVLLVRLAVVTWEVLSLHSDVSEASLQVVVSKDLAILNLVAFLTLGLLVAGSLWKLLQFGTNARGERKSRVR